jgi:hypothetical protein
LAGFIVSEVCKKTLCFSSFSQIITEFWHDKMDGCVGRLLHKPPWQKYQGCLLA